MGKNPKLYLALALIPQIIIVKILINYPELIESYYSNGLYVWISKLSRFVFGWLPFSFGDIFYAMALIYIVRWLLKNRWRFIKDLKGWLIDVLATISVFYFAFHMLWALNYYRQPLHVNLGLEADYNTEELVLVTQKLIRKSNFLHNHLENNDSIKIVLPFSKSEILSLAHLGYKNLTTSYPNFDYAPVSIKKSLFSLPLTYMGFSGYLNPLTNEAHIDNLIPAYKFPTTVSHEIAHQLGYAAENEANFIGALAALSHNNDYFKYCGYTFALRHCLIEIYKRDPELYHELIESVNYGIIKNYQEVQMFWDTHKNPLEPLFKKTYNGFLVANNQKDGMQSYSYVVALFVNYFSEKKS